MAYLAFSDLGGIPAVQHRMAAAPDRESVAADGARLSALEWSVVMLARRDRLASLRRPGRLALALGVLFDRRNPALADARLEALRRAAVLAWHAADGLPEAEVRAFLRAGFTRGQYETLIASIRAARSMPPTPGTRRRGVLSARFGGGAPSLKSRRSRGLHGRA